ncbi:MAG: hydrogenase expression/formation protein HypE [Chitinivibrionales bacterium]|nr:hydrogenase expression/formation protein HypE [Chitinivibrionales bacterium]
MTITKVLLSHGSGAGLEELLTEVIKPVFYDAAATLEDAAVISLQGKRIAFTTDSFVVTPLEFPGGDIGKLAACGTINDCAMMGGKLTHMAVSLIIEEGLEIALLTRCLQSLATACRQMGATVCCGDTKVVNTGKADGLYITTSGFGPVVEQSNLSVSNAKPGDVVILSGPVGAHGITILAQRGNLGFAANTVSDCAALWEPVERLLAAVPTTRCLRDATRGGAAAVFNEIAIASAVTIRLRQQEIAVLPTVAGACHYLGFDPLQIANEGVFAAVVPAADSQRACQILADHPLGAMARCVGIVESKGRFPVVLQTEIGGVRPVELPSGQLLPRIC